MGLGLFYVKTMIEKHGGSVSVKSELERKYLYDKDMITLFVRVLYITC